MGVEGLWKILSPSGRMIDVSTLRGKMLAVDASIWLTQFLKAMRDEDGKMVVNGHILGTLRRICKLMYHRIRTIFVFDGGVPFLKRRIMEKRRQRQAFDEVRRQRAARGLLANQLLLQNEARRGKFIQKDDEPEDLAEKERKARKQRIVLPSDDEEEGHDHSTNDASDARAVTLIDDDEEESDRMKTPVSNSSLGADNRDVIKLDEEESVVYDEEEDDEEDDDDIFRSKRYQSHADIDLSIIPTLPVEEQHKILVKLRGEEHNFNREDLIPVAGDPVKYSATQLEHFLKGARRRKEINELQKRVSASGRKGGGSRIVSDFTREYTLVLDPKFNAKKQEQKPVVPVSRTVASNEIDAEDAAMSGLSLLQKECVEKLFAGLEGTQTKEACLSLLRATNFAIQPLIDEYNKTKHEATAIEQLFEGLGGTVDRDTCRALLVSNNWQVEDTIIQQLEAEAQQAVSLAVPVESETSPQDEEHSNAGEPQRPKIVESQITVGEDGKSLRFKFNVNDITNESLSLFADVLEDSKDDGQDEIVETTKDEPQHLATDVNIEEVEWESESQSEDDKDETKKQASESQETVPILPSTSEQDANIEFSKLSTVVVDTSDDERTAKRKAIALSISSEEPEVDDEESDIEVIRGVVSKKAGNDMMTGTVLSSEEALQRALSLSANFTNWGYEAVKRAISSSGVSASGAQPKPSSSQTEQSPRVERKSWISSQSPGTDASSKRTTSSSPRDLKSPKNDKDLSPTQEGSGLSDLTMERLKTENAQWRSEMNRASRDADQVTPEMRQDIMELLRLFGIPYIESPMEAEAQCAALEAAGIVDGVITDDSDVFLFGARRVYKNIFTDRKNVEAYDVDEIEQQLGLDREKFIHLALLMGSDYTEGIKGIGIVNAVEVVNAFPGPDGLERFKNWVHEGQTKANEESGKGKKRKKADPDIDEGDSPQTAEFKRTHARMRMRLLIHDAFPEERVVDAYTKPNVHDFAQSAHKDRLSWSEPDIDGLYVFCKQRLHWADERFDKEILEPIKMFMNKKNIQTSMDQFVVRFEDKKRFAAIRSKRMAKAVHGIRNIGHKAPEDDSIVAVDELGNVIPLEAKAKNIKGMSAAEKMTIELNQTEEEKASPSASKRRKVVQDSSSSSENEELESSSDDEEEGPLL